jgi:hypothetical protein
MIEHTTKINESERKEERKKQGFTWPSMRKKCAWTGPSFFLRVSFLELGCWIFHYSAEHPSLEAVLFLFHLDQWQPLSLLQNLSVPGI